MCIKAEEIDITGMKARHIDPRSVKVEKMSIEYPELEHAINGCMIRTRDFELIGSMTTYLSVR